MKLFDHLELENGPEADPVAVQKVEEALADLERRGIRVDSQTRNMFSHAEFFNALPASIREQPDVLGAYIANCSRFHESVRPEREKTWAGDTSGLLGQIVEAPAVQHQDGHERHAESGRKVNVAYLRTLGIDPTKVLFFRVTQPSQTPKPELYWTSDFFETRKGLNAEIPAAQRQKAVILVADLETVDANSGLIQDINDDSGLPVRQLGTGPFDQKEALAIIHPTQHQ